MRKASSGSSARKRASASSSAPFRMSSKIAACSSKLSAPGIRPTQPARSDSVSSTPARPLKTRKAPSVSSISRRSVSGGPSAFRSATLGWLRLRVLSAWFESPTPRNWGAFWIATGSVAPSATRPKKRTSSASPAPETGGGCSTSQRAPFSAAARAKASWPSTVGSEMVTASGSRPARASATQSRNWRRSDSESLPVSPARPKAATPWAPWRTTASTSRASAARSSRPSAPKKA